MSEPFLAEVRMFGFDFAPRGWAFLDGQLLPINQNQSLYSLLGTTYGGDGSTTFALPDLRGRTPIHRDSDYRLGARSGEESVALSKTEIPTHTHAAMSSASQAQSGSPTDHVLAAEVLPDAAYRDAEAANMTPLTSATVAASGGGQAHNNMQPYQTLNFCIAMHGLFPSRN
ncbi:phage tail protein [Tritonibacter scottomollicae]|uniref:Microcystin-dependent protein n=1 Tax=Tritonibacter scottomollicae TaxID=483013 RepID=A0A2T1ANJ5_TRISK|nr:tail fiber protein [Tritonibacter scottomollicae]PRZ50186.1 microcystin-dependent protein [Tritonibacter scottomollicae]